MLLKGANSTWIQTVPWLCYTRSFSSSCCNRWFWTNQKIFKAATRIRIVCEVSHLFVWKSLLAFVDHLRLISNEALRSVRSMWELFTQVFILFVIWDLICFHTFLIFVGVFFRLKELVTFLLVICLRDWFSSAIKSKFTQHINQFLRTSNLR